MAQITKESALATLRGLCDEFAPGYLTKVKANKSAYDVAKSQILAEGGTVSKDALESKGYTDSYAKEEKAYLQDCARTLQSRNVPTGFSYDCDISLSKDDTFKTEPNFIYYSMRVRLKPDNGIITDAYTASLSYSACKSSTDIYYLQTLNNSLGDYTGTGTNTAKTDNDPKTKANGQISALGSNSTSTDTKVADTNTFTEPTFTNDADRQKNAEMAAQHPERTVNGIYYADDNKLAQAKAAYESKTKSDSSSGAAAGTAAAQKLVSAMKAVNTTLYGTENEEVVKQLQGSVGSLELNSVLGNAISVRNRQKLLNFKKFKYDYKKPNSGKPPQNRDPYPVDQKIEEFETHQPKVKIYSITTYVHAQAPAVAAVMQFDATEKRLVRLENNLATLTRYFYRLGARVLINCVYYGGQSTFGKESIDIL